MMIHARDLAMGAVSFLGEYPEARDSLCEIAVAFPVASLGTGGPRQQIPIVNAQPCIPMVEAR